MESQKKGPARVGQRHLGEGEEGVLKNEESRAFIFLRVARWGDTFAGRKCVCVCMSV